MVIDAISQLPMIQLERSHCGPEDLRRAGDAWAHAHALAVACRPPLISTNCATRLEYCRNITFFCALLCNLCWVYFGPHFRSPSGRERDRRPRTPCGDFPPDLRVVLIGSGVSIQQCYIGPAVDERASEQRSKADWSSSNARTRWLLNDNWYDGSLHAT